MKKYYGFLTRYIYGYFGIYFAIRLVVYIFYGYTEEYRDIVGEKVFQYIGIPITILDLLTIFLIFPTFIIFLTLLHKRQLKILDIALFMFIAIIYYIYLFFNDSKFVRWVSG